MCYGNVYRHASHFYANRLGCKDYNYGYIYNDLKCMSTNIISNKLEAEFHAWQLLKWDWIYVQNMQQAKYNTCQCFVSHSWSYNQPIWACISCACFEETAARTDAAGQT